MGKRLVVLLSIIIVFLMISGASAQSVRDYEIVSVDSELIDNTFFRVTIVVTNSGAAASSDTELLVTIEGDSEPLKTAVIEPIASGGSIAAVIEIPLVNFEAGTQQTLEISVGIDNFELANTPIARNNFQSIVLDIPERASSISIFERTEDGVIILGEAYTLVQFSLAILASVGVLMLLWVFTLVIRAIFSRPPRFGTWQPPYGVMPMYDQNTVEGRRWGWQQLAQNGLLLAPPTEGNIHPVKLLMSADGVNLTNWKVTGMRLSQYDVYGRIARTQVLAEKKWVRRMNNVLKKRATSDEVKLQKLLRPITERVVKQFTKKVTKKTAFLPIAFDIRWEGKHGDVRIIFELYQFAENAWYRIDQWDPMMQVVSQSMQENYTFTIHGKETAEKMRDFRERLRDDLIWVLLESFRIEALAEEKTGQQPAVRQQYEVPDTLSGMNPIQADEQVAPVKSGGYSGD